MVRSLPIEPVGRNPGRDRRRTGNSRIVTVHPLPRQATAIREIREYGRTFVRDHRGLQPPVPQERPEAMEDRGFYRTFCRDCPFKGMMDILKARNMPMICDAGCSVLGMTPPYAARRGHVMAWVRALRSLHGVPGSALIRRLCPAPFRPECTY